MTERFIPYHKTELDLRFKNVCLQILDNARNELYLSMRYLDLALSALEPEITPEYPGFGTDGRIFYVHPHRLMDLFEENALLVNRVFMHTVMHCLLRHLFKRRPEDVELWDLSCDIAVESIIDSLRFRSVRTGVSRLRMNWYDLLRTNLKVLTAEGVYHVLSQRSLTPFERSALLAAFHIDDHTLWQGRNDGNPPDAAMEMLRDQWQDISEKTQTQMETLAADDTEGTGDLNEQIRAEHARRYEYRSFLRKFSVLHEEMHTDPDNFDYVFYTYGLSLYKNMPLVEPLESREVQRIRDFVIVLDVSMSTQGELVRQFLDQTYEVLTENETYLNHVHIRIIQWDEQVLEDVKVTSREELETYMKHFRLKGGGGTDFRPAFAYVRELVRQKAFSDLKGMLYFTDGRGTYPRQKPPWDTAFVFLEEDFTDINVPPWAIRLILPVWQAEKKEELGTAYAFL